MSKPKTSLTVIPGAAPGAEITLRGELDEMKRAGLLRELPGERWELTPAGRQALEAAQADDLREAAVLLDLAVGLIDRTL